MAKLRCKVHMKLEVVVEVGLWDGTETFATLHKRAEREANTALAHALQGTVIGITSTPGTMRVVTEEV